EISRAAHRFRVRVQQRGRPKMLNKKRVLAPERQTDCGSGYKLWPMAATDLKRLFAALAIVTTLVLPVRVHTQPARTPLYLDASAPIQARVDDLISRMTLKEKVGQLN